MKNLLTTTALVITLAFSGAALAHDGGPDGGPGWDKPPHEMQEALSKLPADKAQLVKDSMKATHKKNKELFEQVRKLHDEKTALLTAPTFDKTAFLAKTKELIDVQDKMKENMAESFAGVAAQLSPEERKILAEAEPHRGMHGPWHHHDGQKADKTDTNATPADTKAGAR